MVCGSLALLSAVNVRVISLKECKEIPLLTENVNAQSASLFEWFIENMESNQVYYKYNEHTGLSCTPFELTSGKVSVGSQKHRDLQNNLGALIDASKTISGTRKAVGGDIDFDFHSTNYNNRTYDFNITISIVGQDWKIMTCEPCSKDDPARLYGACVLFDECLDVMKGRISTYMQLFSL